MQQIRATELSRDFLRMMTKRRAESSSPYETPAQKKKCRTECDAEPELEAVHALHASTAAASPPGLFSTLIGERRRKRPRYCEDHEQHARAGLPGHTLSNATGSVNKETGDGCVSGKFRRASEVTSKESTSGSKLEERLQVTRPDDNKDELCAFNSFQFWRMPLPALDLSLLDSPSTSELNEDSSCKDDTEEMET